MLISVKCCGCNRIKIAYSDGVAFSRGRGDISTHGGSVDSLRVIVDHSGQPKVGHFTDEVAVDEDVACCQVAVHVAHVGEVAHAGGNATQHTDQLDHRELAVVFLWNQTEAQSRLAREITQFGLSVLVFRVRVLRTYPEEGV